MAIVVPVLLAFANSDAKAEPRPLQQILKSIDRAEQVPKTDFEWHKQEAQYNKLKMTFMSTQFSSNDRCAELRKMPVERLVSFYDEIELKKNKQLLDCQRELSARLQQYFSLKTEALARSYRTTAKQILSPCSERQSPVFGPEMDYFVDPQKGGHYTGTNFPRCQISLTFDDGPHPTLTPDLLETLDDQNIRVNFFVVGRRVVASRDILRAQHTARHVIGNHSMTHADLGKISFKAAVQEIEDGYDRITETLKDYIPFFRFPYGDWTKDLRVYLNHLSRVEFFWNIDTLDWKLKDPEVLFEHVLQEIEKAQRGIVLFHDIQPQTITVMPFVLDSLREAGYIPTVIRPTNDILTSHVP